MPPCLRSERSTRASEAIANSAIGIIPLGGTSMALPTALGINDWGNLTAGVQTVLPQGVMAFLNYQGQYMNGGQNNGVLGGFRLEF